MTTSSVFRLAMILTLSATAAATPSVGVAEGPSAKDRSRDLNILRVERAPVGLSATADEGVNLSASKPPYPSSPVIFPLTNWAVPCNGYWTKDLCVPNGNWHLADDG